MDYFFDVGCYRAFKLMFRARRVGEKDQHFRASYNQFCRRDADISSDKKNSI